MWIPKPPALRHEVLDELERDGKLTPVARAALEVLLSEVSCPATSDFVLRDYVPYKRGLEAMR